MSTGGKNGVKIGFFFFFLGFEFTTKNMKLNSQKFVITNSSAVYINNNSSNSNDNNNYDYYYYYWYYKIISNILFVCLFLQF